MILEDHAVVGERDNLEELLGNRYSEFIGVFPESRVHRMDNTSIEDIYKLSGNRYKTEDVIFVDREENRVLRQMGARVSSLKLLLLKDPYSLSADKAVVFLLASGGDVTAMPIRGLISLGGNVFILDEIVPVDVARALKRYYTSMMQSAGAA